MADQQTIQDVTFDLFRKLGITTVFGNPGSTEETFLMSVHRGRAGKAQADQHQG